MTRQIRIARCSDPLLWYAGHIGAVLPVIALNDKEGWKVRQIGTGWLNYVRPEDAEILAQEQGTA